MSPPARTSPRVAFPQSPPRTSPGPAATLKQSSDPKAGGPHPAEPSPFPLPFPFPFPSPRGSRARRGPTPAPRAAPRPRRGCGEGTGGEGKGLGGERSPHGGRALTWMNWMVSADLPTPPPPTTTSRYFSCPGPSLQPAAMGEPGHGSGACLLPPSSSSSCLPLPLLPPLSPPPPPGRCPEPRRAPPAPAARAPRLQMAAGGRGQPQKC